MSNYLAIATATAALQRILQASVQMDVDGVRVTTVKPGNLGSGTPETGINLFLYQVSPNPIWTNANGKARSSTGQIAKRSQIGLDLYYLISFYGNEVELEPQCLLGSVLRTLQDTAVLTPKMIRETIADSNFSFLANSDLAEQVEMIQFKQLALSLEDLSKIWSVFFQAPYVLSIAYQSTVVLIEGQELAQKALPVRQTRYTVVPFLAQPRIERVVSQEGVVQPILADSTILLQGQRLQGNVTQIRIGDVEVSPLEVSDKQISLPLSSVPTDSLQAGVQSLQVVHRILVGTPSVSTRAVESNAAPFILRPSITQSKVIHVKSIEDEILAADVTVKVDLAIAKTQRVVLLLNEWSIDNPVAYIFDALKRRQNCTKSITFAIKGVKPGEYLVRIQVDGAESMLNVDTNPDSATFEQYISPKIVLRNRGRGRVES